MASLLVLIVAIHIVGALLVLFSVSRAPVGYEDEEGFHKKEADAALPEPQIRR